MILYFTGTGNSRYTAQELNRFCGDELVSMNREMRKRRQDPYNARYAYTSERPFVIVCPTYCWKSSNELITTFPIIYENEE